MKSLTRRLLTNLNLANQLTFLRLVSVPFFVILVLKGRFGWALALFLGAAVTDMLDGLSARLLEQRTPLGAYLDPAADKLLLTAAFVMLTEYPTMLREIPMVARLPIWLTVLTIFRDVSIVAIAVILYVTHGQKRFPPSIWGKLATTVEFLTISACLLANSVGRSHVALDGLIWSTLAITLLSGFHYLWTTIARLNATGSGSEGASP